MKHNNKEHKTAPKWKYNQLLTLATLNVRGMKEITKIEQIITHMIAHRIDILCLQETKMPGSNLERKDTHACIFHRIYKNMRNIMESDFASITKWKIPKSLHTAFQPPHRNGNQ